MTLISAIAPEFKDTDEQSHRQFMRRQVRNAKISKYDRDVVLAVLNHWFAHKQKGVMHPGRDKIAKVARVSVRTVATMFGRMREAGVLEVVSHGKGGRHATRYKMNLTALIKFLGYELPKEVAGTLRKIPAMVGRFTPWAVFKKRANGAHGIKDKRTHLHLLQRIVPFPDERSSIFGGQCDA